eukprot:TRINITY_DN29589_c0_g1_i1.p1 TRINITY_DN29589_c0_g1~~TRINITY_DN29589_c0_g1_i1.p1  ORF type:complete len:171 (+),score=7.00 TRINITY_DN29589_c0_g1_i1:57-569(+)
MARSVSYTFVVIVAFLAIVSTIEAVSRKDKVQGLIAVQKSKTGAKAYFEAALTTLAHFVPRSGNVTILIPVNAIGWYRTIQGVSTNQKEDIRRYQMLDGYFRYSKLQNLPQGIQLPTLLGPYVTKFTQTKYSLVGLVGKGDEPSYIVLGDLYVGDTMVIHLISQVLQPTG